MAERPSIKSELIHFSFAFARGFDATPAIQELLTDKQWCVSNRVASNGQRHAEQRYNN
jgi:hypothetical protein